MFRSSFVSRAHLRTAAGLTVAVVLIAGGADGEAAGSPDLEAIWRQTQAAMAKTAAWYKHSPPADRVTWGGLGASALLGGWVLLERWLRLGRRRVVPKDFTARFLERLQDGRLDAGKALDFCELNPSPASRVALAAVRRWGRPTPDLERGVTMALRVETDRLRRNVGTLRRVSALTPLLGLLGTLFAAERALNAGGEAWGPAIATALSPLTAGVAIAIVALVAYDGLMGRVEALAGTLERLGTETVDAIVLARPAEQRTPHARPAAGGAARTPRQLRTAPSEPLARPADYA
jgi:biopolymer transport protein ExbB